MDAPPEAILAGEAEVVKEKPTPKEKLPVQVRPRRVLPAPPIPVEYRRMLRLEDGLDRRRQLASFRGPTIRDDQDRISHTTNLLMVYLCTHDGYTVRMGSCLKMLTWSGVELWTVMRWAMEAGYVQQQRGRKLWVFTSCPVAWGWTK